ncbi:choice-of-anchor D domain-containing protein [Beggiatoa leptomitoformis]|uniref:Choice-of-anchor D domain-containing protein n=1 Tax=Beggiatoa leptomitoformis TaxID=288004 RepID=A0A2N9YH94_9GAMM|nr:choice-of-anchor D domain-containing protein [Beggiatoa leptomitoformis]ALG67814.1 choice-of-anchor D domain-containing protein [Beggiatoa leptomitoformis]AUI69931.1 choice-of-anchor D domain-containing protein [Beggiatoa leptomitoformis]
MCVDKILKYMKWLLIRPLCYGMLVGLSFISHAQASPLLVTNTADSGSGSLRQAIIDANATLGIDTINFNISGGTLPHTIVLLSALPTITDFVFIDGTSEPDFITAGTPVIRLDGISAGAGSSGLVITAGASTISNLIIENFDQQGIILSSGGGNTIISCYIGVDGHGLGFRPNAGNGILISDSSLNVIQESLIAANSKEGIAVTGTSKNNEFKRNSIYANRLLDIDLDADGVTSNDVNDGDSGVNGLQNFPVLAYAYNNQIIGSLNSTNATSFRLEFFANPSANVHTSGHGGGTRYLGGMTVSTINNVADFTFNYVPVAGHPYISATATNLSTVETSEYSLTILESQPVYTSQPLPGASLTFSSPVNITSSVTTLTITDDSNVPLSVTLSTPTGTNASDFTVLPLGHNVLLPSASLDVNIRCTPSAVGLRTAILTVLSDDPNKPSVDYPLECTGTVASVAGFASTPAPNTTLELISPVGTPSIATISVTETGNADLLVTVDPLVTTSPSDFTLMNGAGSFTVVDGGSPLLIPVRCIPSTASTESATLTLRTNSPTQPIATYIINCTGTALPQAGFASTPAPNTTLELISTVGTPSIATISVAETGNADLLVTVDPLVTASPSDFTLMNGAGSFTVADGGSPLLIPVRCIPSTASTESATLTLRTNSPTQPIATYTINCTGTALPQAGFASTPAPNTTLELISPVGTPTTTTITILETGNAALTVTVDPLIGTNTSSFSLLSGTGDFIIADGGNPLMISIRCLPSVAGTESVTLALKTNAPTQLTASYTIVCTGTTVPVTPIPVDPTPDDGNRAPTDITLSNSLLLKQDAVGTVVGTLSTTDPNPTDTHTYLLMNDNNGRFGLLGNQLITKQLFETVNTSYSISITSVDNKGLSFTKQFLLTVSGAEITGLIQTALGDTGEQISIDAPETITVTGLIKPDSRHVGVFADIIVTYYWEAPNNINNLTIPITLAKNTALNKEIPLTLFTGNLAFLAGEFRVKLGYRFGSTLIENEIITLTVNTNRQPTALQLSNTSVSEYSARGTTIGTISAVDPDKQDQFHYVLLNNDEGRFILQDNVLQVNNGYLLQADDTHHYQVAVRAMDIAGKYIDQDFTLQITQTENLPLNLQLTRQTIAENSLNGSIIGRFTTQQQKADTYHYRLIDDAEGRFQIIQDLLIVADTQKIDYETATQHTIIVETQADTSGTVSEKEFTITVLNHHDLKVQGQVITNPDNDERTIQLRLQPDTQDIGKTVGLIVVGAYIQSGYLVDLFNLTPTTWQVWDRDLASLETLQQVTLVEGQTITVWQGALTDFNDGSLAIYAGYYITDTTTGEQTLVYDPQAFVISF